MRIPDWAHGTSIALNGTRLKRAIVPGRYETLERDWSAGDKVELTLPMRVRLMESDWRVEATRGQAAVMRGPILYCLESTDLPEGVPISEIALPAAIELVPRYDPQLLGGITVLEGKAARVQRTGRALYTEIAGAALGQVPIQLIPYYAWNNRGISQMTVWMPLDR